MILVRSLRTIPSKHSWTRQTKHRIDRPTHETRLPKLPNFTRGDIRRIFNGALSTERGNSILSQVQTCRETGRLDTLIDIPQDILEVALHYLRVRFPLDEDKAIVARIDEELNQVYGASVTGDTWNPQGQSGLEQIRNSNIEKRRDAERKAKESQIGTVVTADSVALNEANAASLAEVDALKREPAWVTQYRTGAMETEMPVLTTWKRLVPSGILFVGVSIASLLFVGIYQPPSLEARIFPEVPPAAAMIATLIGVTSAVFVAWRIPPFWAFMNRYFISVPLKPRPIQLLLAPFSHQKLGHLLTNMIPFYFIGTNLHDDIGRGPFLALLVSGAAFTSYATLSAYVLRNHLTVTNIGASGVLTSCVGAVCVLHEGRTISLPLVPREWTAGFNSGVVLLALILMEMNGLRKYGLLNRHLVNYAGHLAGYLYGAGIGFIVRKYDAHWQDIPRRSLWSHSGPNDALPRVIGEI